MKDFNNISDPNLIICRCEEITKKEVVEAISEGYVTVSEVRKRTRSGMGFCQGKTCGRLIEGLINEYTGIDKSLLEPARVRPPVRPISVKVFTKGADEL